MTLETAQLTQEALLKELYTLDYVYFLLMSLAADNAIVSEIPTIENMLKSKRWVIVMGEKSCVLKFIEGTVLDEKMVYIHNTPFTLLAILNKDAINQKLFMRYNINHDKWRKIQYIIIQSYKEKCYVLYYDELPLRYIGKISIIDAIKYMHQMISSTKIACCVFNIGCDIDIDSAINDIKKKIRNDDFLALIGPSWDIEYKAYASSVLCNATPTVYRIYKPPFTHISVALINKCKAFYELYNETEKAEKLTEEGFKHLKIVLYTNVYIDNEGNRNLEGVTYFSNDPIDSAIDAIKQLCSMDEQ